MPPEDKEESPENNNNDGNDNDNGNGNGAPAAFGAQPSMMPPAEDEIGAAAAFGAQASMMPPQEGSQQDAKKGLREIEAAGTIEVRAVAPLGVDGIRGVAPVEQLKSPAATTGTTGVDLKAIADDADEDDEEEEVLVKTEFVWADGAERDVKLSGAWNGWLPIQMYHEGGGMWSVVTPVPSGTHEFKFVVDGEWKHSTRHPTVGESVETMNNIRVIKGPPPKNANKKTGMAPTSDVGSPIAASRARQQADRKQNKGCCVIA